MRYSVTETELSLSDVTPGKRPSCFLSVEPNSGPRRDFGSRRHKRFVFLFLFYLPPLE